jgi:hypothetical protein
LDDLAPWLMARGSNRSLMRRMLSYARGWGVLIAAKMPQFGGPGAKVRDKSAGVVYDGAPLGVDSDLGGEVLEPVFNTPG